MSVTLDSSFSIIKELSDKLNQEDMGGIRLCSIVRGVFTVAP